MSDADKETRKKGKASLDAAGMRKPVAFSLDPAANAKITIEEQPDAAPVETIDAPVPPEPRLFSLSGLFWAALWALLSMVLVVEAIALIERLAGRAPWLGQVAMVLLGVIGLALVWFILREIFGILRQRKIGDLRKQADLAWQSDDPASAKVVLKQLVAFYASDATTAAGRREIEDALDGVHDAPTLIEIAERALLSAKDQAAERAIRAAAQRVSVVTALSPRAIVDLVFVLVQSLALIRTLADLYGGRANGLALFRLAAKVGAHLAVTGGVAMSESLLGQILGAGFAARLSAKLGEGVLNGILTARVGIAASELLRPMSYRAGEPVKLSEVVKNIIARGKIAENPAASS